MPLDQINQEWKDAVDLGKRITVKGARVSLIDDTFWQVEDEVLPVDCETGGTVDPITGSTAHLSKRGNDHICERITRVCAGVDIPTEGVGSQDNPILRPPRARVAGRSIMRRPLLPIP